MAKRVRPRPEFAQQVRVAELLREFDYPDLDTQPPATPTEGTWFSIDVAASDAPQWEKDVARYQCDGVDDHVEIQQALDDKFLEGGSNNSEVTLSSGSFNVGEGWVYITENITLRGQGQTSTWIRNQTVGTIHDNPSGNNGVFLVYVEQDGELCDLGIFTSLDFQGTCIISNYALVHDVNHIGGTAQRFLYIRGSIGPTYNIRSWGRYNNVPEDDKRACIETDENWVALTGVYMSVNGTGLWIGDHQGGASITGVAIDKNGPEPAIFLANAGYVAMGDISIRDFSGDGPGIMVESTPFKFNLSNINIHGTTVGLTVKEGFWGLSEMDISNFSVSPFVSGIDLYDTSASTALIGDISIKGYRCNGNTKNATGWGIRIDVSGKVLISDFHIEGMDEDGILLEGPSTDSIIHDGYIEGVGKHGVVLDAASAHVHDVIVNGAGQAAANTYDAFHLMGSMDTPRLHDNKILVPSQLRYGINIADSGVVRAIVVGNSGGDPSDFGTDALDDQGTDTQLVFPSDATYGDNFFRSGSSSGADQIEQVTSLTLFNEREREQARPVIPRQPPQVVAASESEGAQTVTPVQS